MSSITLFLITFVFAMSSKSLETNESKRKLSSISTEATTIELAPLKQSTLRIHPRPNIDANFKGPENNLCYNYANLLVRNGQAAASDTVISDKQALLSSIYQYGKIIIHHTATWQTPAQLVSAAISYNGWSDIGYHFTISKDGTITKGRSLFYMGANAGRIPKRDEDCKNNMYYIDKDNDYRGIGITLIGNFDHNSPSHAQIDSLQQLISDLKERFKITEIKPHKDYKNTNCPGKNFMALHNSLFSDKSPEETTIGMAHRSPFIFNANNKKRNICYSCQ